MKLWKHTAMAGLIAMGTMVSGAMADETPWTKGTIKKIDTAQSKITIKHEPIKNLDMPAMTMIFFAPDASVLEGLKKGDRKQFEFGDLNGRMILKQVK